jgi:hypothetical protein
MFEVEETRYPFDNFFEFIAGGYWGQIEALHLTLGWGFILVFVFRLSNLPIPFKFRLAIPYFALAVFTNPAYDFFGLKLNEVFGVLAVLFGVASKLPIPNVKRPIPLALLILFVMGSIHSLLVSLIYPELLVGAGVVLTKIAVTFKIFVLTINLLIVGHFLRNGTGLKFVFNAIISAGVFGALMYLMQAFVLFGLGVFPYGTFSAAGSTGFPSFGSVSVERGHFGKFMAPLFPFFLFALISWRWRFRFALYVLVMLINVSASSLAFFSSYVLISLVLFRSQILNLKSGLLIFCVFTAISGLAIQFDNLVSGVVDKIYNVAFLGDESGGGGRSLGVFYEYISSYPLGIGYSGSTLRTAPGLSEINAGYLAFITQYSALSVVICLGYISLILLTLRVVRRNGKMLVRSMAAGVLVSPLIFAADVLWFIPTIWLAFEVIWSSQRKSTEACFESYAGSSDQKSPA